MISFTSGTGVSSTGGGGVGSRFDGVAFDAVDFACARAGAVLGVERVVAFDTGVVTSGATSDILLFVADSPRVLGGSLRFSAMVVSTECCSNSSNLQPQCLGVANVAATKCDGSQDFARLDLAETPNLRGVRDMVSYRRNEDDTVYQNGSLSSLIIYHALNL